MARGSVTHRASRVCGFRRWAEGTLACLLPGRLATPFKGTTAHAPAPQVEGGMVSAPGAAWGSGPDSGALAVTSSPGLGLQLSEGSALSEACQPRAGDEQELNPETGLSGALGAAYRGGHLVTVAWF